GDAAHVQSQALAGILLGDGDQRRADARLDAEFLAQLAHQRLLRRFTGLALAAGEFPQAGKVAALGAARKQHAPARVGDGAGDDFDGSGVGSRESGVVQGQGSPLPLVRSGFARDGEAGPPLRPGRRIVLFTIADFPFPTPGSQARCPWPCLYFLPLPQGQGSLRPTLGPSRVTGVCAAASWAWRACSASSSAPRPPESACWTCIWRAAASAWARSCASSAATSSSVRMRTRASSDTTSRLTLASISLNSSKASRLYSCLGCFCA